MDALTETYRALTLDLATHITEMQAVESQMPDVFDEDVRGMIFECGDYISWKLYYGDRFVGTDSRTSMQHSDTDEEAINQARTMIKEAQAIAAICYPFRYSDTSQWHIRIY